MSNKKEGEYKWHDTLISGIIAVVMVFSAYYLSQAAGPINTVLEVSKAYGTATADYNGDGNLDIFITGHDSNDRIWYRNASGTYVAGNQAFGRIDSSNQQVDRHDCDAADYNKDGRMDFFCAVGADRGTGTGENELWTQQLNGTFAVNDRNGAEDSYGRGRQPVFFNFNGDIYPDIYLSNYGIPRADGMPNIDRVFVNNGTTSVSSTTKVFQEVPVIANINVEPNCVVKGDINKDGYDDIIVCQKTKPGLIYMNNKMGNFATVTPPNTNNWADAKLEDMNNDGWLDLVVTTINKTLFVYYNTKSGNYFSTKPTWKAALAAKGNGLAIGDFNSDGRKDMYVQLIVQNCQITQGSVDAYNDVVYYGSLNNTWTLSQLNQSFAGCGSVVDYVGGNRVVDTQGDDGVAGNVYLIEIQ